MIKGRLFCITGILENFTKRQDAFDEIIHHGGNTTKKLTKDCDYLVIAAKGNPNYIHGNKGSKQVKAEKWLSEQVLIRIISENQFISLLETTEELDEEQWGKDLSGEKRARWSPIKRFKEDDLEISTSFMNVSEIDQVLRIEYNSHRSEYKDVQEWCKAVGSTVELLNNLKLKTLNKHELIPIDWFEEGDEGYDYEDPVVYHHRIIALLHTDEQKQKGTQLATQVLELFLDNKVKGELSLRIWDGNSRYGKHWLQQFK